MKSLNASPLIYINEDITDICDKQETESVSSSNKEKHTIAWHNVIMITGSHLAATYGAYLLFTFSLCLATCVFSVITGTMSGIGVTAGAHRLWAHRSYKAKLPLRIFLAFWFSMAVESSIFMWVRDHRTHHKFTETDADPYNSKRGFFFSHVGWLMCGKHRDVTEKGKTLDFSDLLEDPVVRFQKKYFYLCITISSFVLPTVIPVLIWGETLFNSFFIVMFRLCCVHNFTWLVNSAAHMWGYQPYDINIGARENKLVVYAALGEGFHNYHHTFPYDYSTSEYGIIRNLTTAFINVMALLGLAYDCKKPHKDLVLRRCLRTGNTGLREKSTVCLSKHE